MKQREYEYKYVCLDTELVATKPPIVDADGVAIPNGSLCEVVGTVSGVVDSIWTRDGGEWYEY